LLPSEKAPKRHLNQKQPKPDGNKAARFFVLEDCIGTGASLNSALAQAVAKKLRHPDFRRRGQFYSRITLRGNAHTKPGGKK